MLVSFTRSIQHVTLHNTQQMTETQETKRLWSAKMCRLVDMYQHFRGTCSLYIHGSSQHIPPVVPIRKIKLRHVSKDSNYATHCHEILTSHTRKVTLILFFTIALSCQHIWEQNIRVQFWGSEERNFMQDVTLPW